MAAAVWRLAARVRGAAAAAALSERLAADGVAVSAFEAQDGEADDTEEWTLSAYGAASLLTPARDVELALLASAAGGALLDIAEERLAERDWLADNRLAFPPLRVGPFFVHASHYEGAAPAGAIAIRIDAATAFGTGEHASTRGCLLALARLARRRRFRDVLDVGTGTGILAIAAAKRLHRRVTAGDVDPGAVDLARRNAQANGVAGAVRIRLASGYRDREIRRRHYDLVLANILARPLALMARDLARVLKPGGYAVLSGLLQRQEPAVLEANRRCGLVLVERIVFDGWSTPILRRGGSGHAKGALGPPS